MEKIQTYFLCSIIFFSKIVSFTRKGRKMWQVRQATNDNMAHVHCMLYAYGYKHTLRECNTYCLSTATLITRKFLSYAL